MKQNDIIALAVVTFVAIIISVFASKLLFSSSQGQQQVDVVPTISSSLAKPNTQFFNSQAVDPTQLIQISPNNNQSLFNSSSQ